MSFKQSILQFGALFTGVVLGSMLVRTLFGTNQRQMPQYNQQNFQNVNQQNQQADVWQQIAQTNYNDKQN